MNIYKNGGYYKFIGKLNWFYNNQTDAEEGYLNSDELSDIYFRASSVKGVSPYDLKKGEKLVIEVSASEVEYQAKIKARSICKLEDENDLEFLLYECLLKNNRLIYEHTLEQVKIQSTEIIKEDFSNYIISFVSSYSIDIHQATFIFNFCENGYINLLDDTVNKVRNQFNSKDQFKLWLQTSASFHLEEIKPFILNYIFKNKTYEILDKLSKNEKEFVLKEVVDKFLKNNKAIKEIAEVLNQFYINNIDFDFTWYSDEQIIFLWSNNLINYSPIDIIFRRLKQLSQIYNNEETQKQEVKAIFEKASNQELKNLFSKIHFEKSKIKVSYNFKLSKLFIDEVKNDNLKQDFFNKIYAKSSNYLKLQWFVQDYTDKIDYNEAVIYTGLLSSKLQKVFFKKILMLIETDQIELSLDDLNGITTIDYETSEYAKDIDGVGLDFTLNIILKIITDLSENRVTKRNTIFDIIASQIKRPDDLLVIDGFFEKCDGRTTIEKKKDNIEYDSNGNPKNTYKLKKTKFLPRFSTLCDGRKAIDKKTGEASLCDKSNLEFWWCENSKCYDPCRNLNHSRDWRSYTLEDALNILNIEYDKTQYEIVLNVVNRVNRFLEHLTCSHCKSILKPIDKSNYAFYGVTIFSCRNHKCEKPDKKVYLTHCLNGKCEGIIDSRKTVKCKSKSLQNSNDCGWYICQNCYACCNTEKIKNRAHILQRTGQEYKCHHEGHKDLGIICCPKCGTETNAIQHDVQLYEQQLQWFINQRYSSAVKSSGQRRNDGKWWFRWNRGNLSEQNFYRHLRGLKRNGFQVPDINSGNDIQFISEPLNKIDADPTNFKCPSCHFELEIKTDKNWGYDYNRLNTIKKYHNKIFSLNK